MITFHDHHGTVCKYIYNLQQQFCYMYMYRYRYNGRHDGVDVLHVEGAIQLADQQVELREYFIIHAHAVGQTE